jgi:hypothetical protein
MGQATLVESSVRLTIAQLAHHDARPTRWAQRLMVPSGDRPPSHFERLFMPSYRTQTRRPKSGRDGWLAILGTRGFHRPLSLLQRTFKYVATVQS